MPHFLEIGREVEIAGIYDMAGYEAYRIKGSAEILLATELEKLSATVAPENNL